MADMNFLHLFRDIHRTIDASLDAGDRTEFGLACREFRDLVTRLHEFVDAVSVADIVSATARHAAEAGRAP